jgi:SAM-dependent methyltransferase
VAGAERPHGACEGRRRLSDPGALWGDTDYDAIVPHYSAIYDELVARLAPAPDERWLDVACGTGEIALRAARAGAAVTGFDISPVMLERARAKADAEGLDVDFVLGDAARLPFSDDSFDVVSSNFGVVFALDVRRAASELTRVCRGRFGYTAWHPVPDLDALYARFGRETSVPDAKLWAAEPGAILDDGFELSVHERTWHLRGESGRAVLEFWEHTAPPTKAYLASLDDEKRERVRDALVERWESYRGDDGVNEPRRYVLVIGTRADD